MEDIEVSSDGNVLNIGEYSIDFSPTENNLDKKINKTEIPLIHKILEELESDDIFYDIGANVGFHTVSAASVIQTGKIYCFEPNPVNFQILNRVVEEITHIPCITKNTALFDKEGELRFDKVRDKDGEGHGHISEDGDIVVETKRLDSIMIQAPDVVKIDVEGAELRVLNGGRETLSGCRAVFLEVHNEVMRERYGNDLGELLNYAREEGWKVEKLYHRGHETFFKLQR